MHGIEIGLQSVHEWNVQGVLPDAGRAVGVNAVLVAPQFAFDAADSSAGKFWEPNGFKHFLDEAAVKLARLYGDPRKAFTFANMPVVIVAYSGGFGPTLSVLDRQDPRLGCTGRGDWMSPSRPPSAFVARHDAPLIGERVATRGRYATEGSG